jgi:hypothetical protein
MRVRRGDLFQEASEQTQDKKPRWNNEQNCRSPSMKKKLLGDETFGKRTRQDLCSGASQEEKS